MSRQAEKKLSVNSFIEKRMQSMVSSQWLPSWFVFIGFILFFVSPAIRTVELYRNSLLVIIFTVSLRLFFSVYFFSVEKGKHKSWYQGFENLNTVYYVFLGASYAGILTLSNIVFNRYVFVFYILFFFVTLGALRSAASSFKSSVGLIVGTFIPLVFIYAGKLPTDVAFIYILAIIFFVAYLLVSQHKLAQEFVLRRHLLTEQNKHIDDLKKRLELEDELKTQKAINIHNARLTALGEMAAGVAHEINNPLTIIALHIKTLDKKLKEGIQLEDIWATTSTQIISAIDRASKIVYSLRSLSRDQKLSDVEEVPFKEVIDKTVIFIEKRFAHNNISFEVIYNPPKDLKVKVNVIACSQVLVNLLNNSFYEMDKIQKVEEKWCKIIVDSEGDLLFVKVVDSGNGIPDEIQEKLFTPFSPQRHPERELVSDLVCLKI